MADINIPYAFKDLDASARHKAYYSGRGAAKSHSFAQKLVLLGAKTPLRILCAREIQKSIDASVKMLLDDKIRLSGLDKFYRSTKYAIEAPNGTSIQFAGLRTNPESIKSYEGVDITWIEEANTVSQNSLNLLIPTVLRKPTSQIWYSWNRRHTKDPVDNMFLGPGGPPPKSVVRKIHWTDNPWFPDALKEQMEWDKSRDIDKWRHVWEGEPIQHSEARVFRNWHVEDIDDQLPPNCPPRLGADWGFSVDPSVLIECYIFDRVLYFRREAWKIKCEIDELPSLFGGTDDRDPPRWRNEIGHTGISAARQGHTIVADSARPDTISYLRNRGFKIVSAKKGPGSIKEGIEFMSSHDIVVHPDCTHIQDELTHYKYKEDPLTGDVLPELEDKDNHTIDSCRYAVEGVRRTRHKAPIQAPQTIELYG